MREQLLWSCGPRTRFVGKHPYVDILVAQPVEPTMAYSTVQRRLQTLERNGQIRSEADTEPRHGGGNYYVWYAT